MESTSKYVYPQGKRKSRTSDGKAMDEKLEAWMNGPEKVFAKVADTVERTWPARAICSSCGKDDHSSSYCKMEESEEAVYVHATGEWNNRGQKGYPFSKTYNLGWQDHLNFRWRDDNNQPRANAQPSQASPWPTTRWRKMRKLRMYIPWENGRIEDRKRHHLGSALPYLGVIRRINHCLMYKCPNET